MKRGDYDPHNQVLAIDCSPEQYAFLIMWWRRQMEKSAPGLYPTGFVPLGKEAAAAAGTLLQLAMQDEGFPAEDEDEGP